MVWGDPFEPHHAGWFFAGGAGFDYGKGLAAREKGNAWVRGTTGWNALNRFHAVFPNTAYTVSAKLRLSPGLTDGYFSVREALELNGNGRIITETKLVGPSDYREHRLNFTTGPGLNRVLFYVGLWGVGRDVWIQIDDFVIAEVTGGSGGQPGGMPTCAVETRYAGFGSGATVRVYGAGFVAGEPVTIFRDGAYAAAGNADATGRYSIEFGQATSLPARSYSVYAKGQSGRVSSTAGYSL